LGFSAWLELNAGLPAANSPRVGIVLLLQRNFGIEGLCGGRIGSSGKMCTLPQCRVSSHAKKQMMEEAFTFDGTVVDEAVFIYLRDGG